VLWATAQEKGYKSGLWGTYKQWQELGAQVRQGEKSMAIVFWKFFDHKESNNDESEDSKSNRIPMARDYAVFNAEQVDGFNAEAEKQPSRAERIEHAEEFFYKLGIKAQSGGNRAYYSPSTDSIHMPAIEAFREPLFYYSVLSHETTHWTGAASRLNRDMAGRFGSESYAVEELVAELGSGFLCASLGLPTDPRKDHAPYINSCLKVLKSDKKAIFTAAAKAQQAVDWMHKTVFPEAEQAA
jgi:antirestriction protein ArdC